MASRGPTRAGLPKGELRRDESVRHYWRAPRGSGRAVLTSQRLFLLGHPAPIHREVLWSLELEKLTELGVVEAEFPPAYRLAIRNMAGKASWVGTTGVWVKMENDSLFVVHANTVEVYSGSPGRAQAIQGWIDEARVARMMAVLGRVLPPTRAKTKNHS